MYPLLVLIASLALPGPRGAVQTAPSGPLATVETMFRVMRTRDTATLRSLFDPGARLVGIRTRPDGTELLQTITVDQWVQYVARDPRPDWTERAFAHVVTTQGTLAQIWAEYDFHFGKTFSHCGVDAVQLLKSGDRWIIVSIADTYQKENCPARPEP